MIEKLNIIINFCERRVSRHTKRLGCRKIKTPRCERNKSREGDEEGIREIPIFSFALNLIEFDAFGLKAKTRWRSF